MKALTIKQPWAQAILYLGKDIENRGQRTSIRGTIAIHAGATLYEPGFQHPLIIGRLEPEDVVKSAIIGVVDIVKCVQKSDSPWFIGKVGYVLRDPRALHEPIACSGARGFWDVPADIEHQIRQQLERA
jgi:hypothetical protein